MDALTSEYAKKLAKVLLKKGKEYVKASLEKDAANRYSLKETWYLPLVDAGGIVVAETVVAESPVVQDSVGAFRTVCQRRKGLEQLCGPLEFALVEI